MRIVGFGIFIIGLLLWLVLSHKDATPTFLKAKDAPESPKRPADSLVPGSVSPVKKEEQINIYHIFRHRPPFKFRGGDVEESASLLIFKADRDEAKPSADLLMQLDKRPSTAIVNVTIIKLTNGDLANYSIDTVVSALNTTITATPFNPVAPFVADIKVGDLLAKILAGQTSIKANLVHRTDFNVVNAKPFEFDQLEELVTPTTTTTDVATTTTNVFREVGFKMKVIPYVYEDRVDLDYTIIDTIPTGENAATTGSTQISSTQLTMKSPVRVLETKRDVDTTHKTSVLFIPTGITTDHTQSSILTVIQLKKIDYVK